MQILFQRTDKDSGEISLLGYTVVKVSGVKFCKCWLYRINNIHQNAFRKA